MATNGYDICLFIELIASDDDMAVGSMSPPGIGAEWEDLGGKGGGSDCDGDCKGEPGLFIVWFLLKLNGGGRWWWWWLWWWCFLLFRCWFDAMFALISLLRKLFTIIDPLTYDKGNCLLWGLFLLGRGGGTSGERFPFGDKARRCGNFCGEGREEIGVEEVEVDGDCDGDGEEIIVLMEVVTGLIAIVLVVGEYCCCKREI